MKKIFVLIVCSACCCISATAQQTYSLEQLKQLAVENNYTLRSARSSIQQSKEVQKSAFTKYFPTLSAMGVGFMNNKPMIDIDLSLPDDAMAVMGEVISELNLSPQTQQHIGAVMAGIPQGITLMKRGIYGTVTALQPVFMGGQIVNGNKLAKVGVQASEIQLENSQNQVELTTEQYYWKAVNLKEKLLTLAAVHNMLDTLERDVNNMVRAGVTNRNDLLQVQLRKGEVEATTLEVENGLTTIRQLLAQHCGKNGETIDVRMPDDFSFGSVPAMPLSLKKDHLASLPATPHYRLLEKNVESQRLQRNLKVGENLPTVAVGADYGYNDFVGKQTNAMLFATVSVPISAWWGGSHDIKKHRLAYEDAKEQLQDAGQKLVINMNNAWAAVETSHKKLVIASDAIKQAEENLRLNRDYYRVGTTKMSDLLTAQEQYQQTRDRFVDAYADFQTKQLEYRQATGQD